MSSGQTVPDKPQPEGLLGQYLNDTRAEVLAYIQNQVPDGRHSGGLYDLILEYPLREGKWLRPSLCMAVSRALGGSVADTLPSAAVLELYHTAFLVHDDIEDGSLQRRSGETLHRKYGVPIAINVGDGILSLAMRPLLDNLEVIGLGRGLSILETVATMARESAEGQMLELDWIHRKACAPQMRDYMRIVYKKTCWYSFMAPAEIGAHCAAADARTQRELRRFSIFLGIAFQVVDDLLNLEGEESDYGKEINGDLWEGKYTPMLIHALNCATSEERQRAVEIMSMARPDVPAYLDARSENVSSIKTAADVRFLLSLIEKYQGIAYARTLANRYVDGALARFERLRPSLGNSVHSTFLEELVTYVVERNK
jgi:geranylgeranyl diphosphate synthase type II